MRVKEQLNYVLTSLLREHLVRVVVLGALDALLLLHQVLAPLCVLLAALLAALLGALLRPPGLLLHHAAIAAAQRTGKRNSHSTLQFLIVRKTFNSSVGRCETFTRMRETYTSARVHLAEVKSL